LGNKAIRRQRPLAGYHGNTVVSSVNRGPADLTFGGRPVVMTAGYPALSPMMGLTHGVHGIGDTIAISVHTAESALADIGEYVDRLSAALARTVRPVAKPPAHSDLRVLRADRPSPSGAPRRARAPEVRGRATSPDRRRPTARPAPATRRGWWVRSARNPVPRQAARWDASWYAQRSADVLLVDHVVGQCDQPAESGGETARFEVIARHVEQLVGRALRQTGNPELVDPVDAEAAPDELPHQRGAAEAVVSEGVCDDIADSPALAQSRRLPLVGDSSPSNATKSSRSARAIAIAAVLIDRLAAAQSPLGAESPPQRHVDPHQCQRFEQPRERQVACIGRLETQLADQRGGDGLRVVVVTTDERHRGTRQLRRVHHRCADLVHRLAHSGTGCPARDQFGAGDSVAHLQGGEVGGQRVRAVDQHRAAEVAARDDRVTCALPRRAQHDGVCADRRRSLVATGAPSEAYFSSPGLRTP